ncbi:MAG: hypothetical protein MZV65_44850 [Chromatiales bacterium]|nr:hypothetical protein [Chromatiales bacterium]
MVEKLRLLGVEPGQAFDPDKIDPPGAQGDQRGTLERVVKLLAEGPFTMDADGERLAQLLKPREVRNRLSNPGLHRLRRARCPHLG